MLRKGDKVKITKKVAAFSRIPKECGLVGIVLSREYYGVETSYKIDFNGWPVGMSEDEVTVIERKNGKKS